MKKFTLIICALSFAILGYSQNIQNGERPEEESGKKYEYQLSAKGYFPVNSVYWIKHHICDIHKIMELFYKQIQVLFTTVKC